MGTPFKMKHQGSPFNMFSGVKSSPARSWWGKLKDLVSKGSAGGDDLSEAEDTNVNNGRISQADDSINVPQHGPESHSRGGDGGGAGLFAGGGGGFLSGLMGGRGGNQGSNRWLRGNRG